MIMTRKLLLSLSVATLGVALSACGTQQPAKYNAYGVDKGAGSVGIHTVLAGDTVYEIAQNYKLPMREIITLNHIAAPYELKAGFRMKLPPPNEYTVREGDTVASIARMYEVSPSQIVSLNELQPPYKLMTRMPLRMPTPTDRLAAQEQAQKAEAQKASYGSEMSQGARVARVDSAPLGQDSSAASADSVVTPQAKPAQVQQASVARAKIPETPKMSGSSSLGKGRFMQPVNGQIISNYGAKADGLYNDGINIKATRGTPVRAAENGVVVYTGDDLAGYGNLVLVRHENKMMSAYAHLDKTLIKRGDKVMRGQSIATVGSSGQVDSPQLHFELRRGSEALDPAPYL